MGETTNYKLYIEDDSSTKFIDWRTKINGSTDSNMVKIDIALGQKADSSISLNCVLYASAWNGVDSPFTQNLTVEGLGASQNGMISLSHEANSEQRDVARNAMLSVVGQNNGVLTIAADGELPDMDIPVVIILLG